MRQPPTIDDLSDYAVAFTMAAGPRRRRFALVVPAIDQDSASRTAVAMAHTLAEATGGRWKIASGEHWATPMPAADADLPDYEDLPRPIRELVGSYVRAGRFVADGEIRSQDSKIRKLRRQVAALQAEIDARRAGPLVAVPDVDGDADGEARA